MENQILSTDIDVQAVLAQYEMEKVTAVKKVKTAFDARNYLNTRLAPGENSKTLAIRLLPFYPKGGTCFHKVMMHTVRVNPEVSQSGWKSFVCPIKNEIDSDEKFGDACPFCETSAQARELRFTTLDEVQKKKYGDVEFLNKAKEMWIVRCIERGHEDDGVKFWMFTNTSKIYDDIITLFNARIESEARRGNKYNPYSLDDGTDLLINIKRDSNKTKIQVVDDNPHSKLTESDEQKMAWVNDPKAWTDVYTVKSYDYMAIIAEGGVPVFDKEKGKYVNKADKMKEDKEAKERELQEELSKSTSKYSDYDGIKVLNGQEFIDDVPY